MYCCVLFFLRTARFDGAGTLTFPTGARFEATWRLGQLVTGMYFFEDQLEYLPRNWQYCTDADRRFWSEQQFGIKFSEFPQLTDAAAAAAAAGGQAESQSIPYGAYDLGDCYLLPKDNRLYNYDHTYYRDPTPEELTWAKRKARIGLDQSASDGASEASSSTAKSTR